MNGIEKITQRIKNDAKTEMMAVADETGRKCEEIIAAARERADATYWEIVGAGKAAAEHCVQLRKSAAQTEGRKRMLQLKQEMVAKAFALAKDKLLHLPEDEYKKFLIKLAVRASLSGREMLVFSASDAEKYGLAVVNAANEILASAGKTAELTLAEERRDIAAGIILSEGRVETDCSLETLMGLRRNELALEVAKLLFE